MKKVLQAWLDSVDENDPKIGEIMTFIYSGHQEKKSIEKRTVRTGGNLKIPKGFTQFVYRALEQLGGKATSTDLVSTLQNMPGFSFSALDEDLMLSYLRKNGSNAGIFKYWKIDDTWSRKNWGMTPSLSVVKEA